MLFCVDGYSYGGRRFDRGDELRQIIGGLTGLEQVIWLPYLNPEAAVAPVAGALAWDEALDHPPVPAGQFRFEQVPFSHPLWILFSSGTTGLPKAIVHGHGGILIEQLKLQRLHMDLRPGDRMFFFTTAGWMMWNFLVSSLLIGVRPVLYDGSPVYPRADVLWQLAQDCGVTFFGASPAYVDLLSQAGIVPAEKYDLSSLRAIMPAGSPVSAECTAWFYRNVKQDVWVATGSGGTDVCTGFVGGVPTEPVYAGEIQARHLGVAAHAFNERGESVVDEVGELVITAPMPSMPVGLWGDTDGARYRESYFAQFPGVWRHGDFFRINSRGGCFALGRSDATLNRHGVRIGTAEVYRVLASIDEVQDALIVNLDLHFPEPLPAFDVLTCEIPYGAIGANTSRVFCFPTTDDELRRLARLAVDCGVDDLFADGCSPAEVLQALTERGEAGERWLAGFDKARDPWFNVSTGDGFYHHHRSWNDDLTVPFAALPRYVRLKSAVTNRPVTGSDLPWWQG